MPTRGKFNLTPPLSNAARGLGSDGPPSVGHEAALRYALRDALAFRRGSQPIIHLSVSDLGFTGLAARRCDVMIPL